MKLKINYSKCCYKDGKSCECKECCIDICPVKALSKHITIAVDEEKCIKCGACVNACPKGALSLE